ncbi:MAG: HTH-type transcriptional regulator LysM [Nitrososphaerales archaeon]
MEVGMPGLDDKDGKILDILKEDARRSFVDIAKAVNLSEPAVRRRIKNLVERGAIRRFTIETEVGQGASAITLISVNPSIPTAQISSKLLDMEGVNVVYEITGQYDIAVIVSGSNIANINKCIDDIRQLEGVGNTNTVIILKTLR